MFAFARVRRRWAAGAFVLGLVAVVIVACGDDDPTPVPTRAPTAQPTATATTAPQPTEPPAMMEVMEESKAGSVVIALGELNDSGQSGKATLTARGDETEVVIDIAAGAAGVAQPIHIHEGTCDTLGGVSFALTSLADGKSTTIVPTTLTSLHAGKFAINGHKSGDEIATYISCGDISADGAMMMEDGDAMEAEATDTPSGGETVASDIRNFQLEDLNIKVGTTVVWTQQDSTTHTATSGTPPNGDGTWDTGFLMEGESGDGVVFDKVGTFVYFCRVHNSMTGTVTVTE
ncbi:MAG: hypothetical protein IIB12_08490 [Chloroflexi bacterium]|nr:hypothetical protein [Chloroflexota bacterium]